MACCTNCTNKWRRRGERGNPDRLALGYCGPCFTMYWSDDAIRNRERLERNADNRRRYHQRKRDRERAAEYERAMQEPSPILVAGDGALLVPPRTSILYLTRVLERLGQKMRATQ